MTRFINSIIIGIWAISSLVIMFAYHSHGSILSLKGLHFLTLYGIAFVISPFIVLTPLRLKAGIIIVFFSSILTVYGLELGVRLIPATGLIPSDNRSILEYAYDNHLTPRFGGANFVQAPVVIMGKQVLPLGGLSNSQSFLKSETGFFEYESDSLGFNNPNGAWKRPGTVSIGDSFTFGASVPFNASFMGLVRSKHPNTLNLGNCGFGPLLELATLKEYVPTLKPKVVLWFYYEGNDLEDLNFEKKSEILIDYLDGKIQNLTTKQDSVDVEIAKRIKHEAAAGKISNYHLSDFVKARGVRQKLGLLINDPADLKLFENIMSDAKSTVEKWNGKLIFIYIPAWERYAKGKEFNRDDVLVIMEKLKIPVIDIHKAFNEDPLQYFNNRLNGHYNEAGNKIVAEEVLREL